ncbi:hypothetical protein ASD11_12235 [Aeromicrobium sp. Root495]|uniref:bifunctional DNA primase/polymerase n=1 Tax=Aeromicrobium sp. Root495 TaxID=1736550 RepID=UPI0006F682E7|nr:bifunctional DNA primase/polymerase [Aeromicrobium sp. Root495]KQY60230.1 hypothetical protein ASD11_12235 [Aeromicrobium sp. Root495]
MINDLVKFNDMSLADAALAFLDIGLSVFPCQPADKRPATTHGFKQAVSLDRLAGKDAEAVEKFRHDTIEFFSAGGYNIGLPTGLQVDVLDVDVKGGKPGLRALRTLRDAGLLDGAVATAETPSGGYHVYYPVSGEKSKSIGSLGLDWKAQGGYVLAGPSAVMQAEPFGFRPYKWLWSRPLDAGSCLTWQQVMDCLGVKKPEPRVYDPDPFQKPEDVVDAMSRWLSSANEGDRNKRLFWAATRCAEAGAREGQLQPLYDTAARIGLTDGEIQATVRSGYRTGTQQ